MTVDRAQQQSRSPDQTGKYEPVAIRATAKGLNLESFSQDELLGLLASVPTERPDTDVSDSGDTTFQVDNDFNSMYQTTFTPLQVFLGELPISKNSYLKFGDGGGDWSPNNNVDHLDPYGRNTNSGQYTQAPAGFFYPGGMAYAVFIGFGQTIFTSTLNEYPYTVGLFKSITDAYVWELPDDDFLNFSVSDKLDAYADNVAGSGNGVRVRVVWEPKQDVLRRILARKYGVNC